MDTHDNPQDPGMVYLPTFVVCFNGILEGNYTSPLDASWDLAIMSWFILKQDTFFWINALSLDIPNSCSEGITGSLKVCQKHHSPHEV